MVKQAKVLLIEDNELLRWYLTTGLSREGFRVVAPATIDEGIRLGTEIPFDVLISDWRLGDGHDGLEVLAKIRQAFPLIPSILISAEADAELTERALDAGFDCVIPKPLEVAEIVGAIAACQP